MPHIHSPEVPRVVAGKRPDQSLSRWRAIQLPQPHVRKWDGFLVLYDHRSGETHMLEGASVAIFEWLLAAPYRRCDLVEKLSTEIPGQAAGADSLVVHLLSELKHHQLVDELPPHGD